MSHRVHQYGPINSGQHWYQPRVYGDPQPDGTWKGWVVFFPTAGGAAIAPPSWETKQTTFNALANWAAGLAQVYLEGALRRALEPVRQSYLIGQLAEAEYDALIAKQLETEADAERTTADLDEAAAAEARADAERLRRVRHATEAELAAAHATAANVEANLHDQAAQNARATAADAERRRRTAQAEAESQPPTKRGGGKKKRATRKR